MNTVASDNPLIKLSFRFSGNDSVADDRGRSARSFLSWNSLVGMDRIGSRKLL